MTWVPVDAHTGNATPAGSDRHDLLIASKTLACGLVRSPNVAESFVPSAEKLAPKRSAITEELKIVVLPPITFTTIPSGCTRRASFWVFTWNAAT